MSIITHDVPTAKPAVDMDPVRAGAVERARAVLAEAQALWDRRFLQDPQAPAVFGRLTHSLDELLWQLTGDAR